MKINMAVRPKQGRDLPQPNDIYNKPKWRKKRKEILNRDGYQCVVCKAEGIITKATVVDHKRAIKEGGSKYGDFNLQSLCKPHHDSKSGGERKK
jgi:5-methylcytosine-specific restriction protein A